MIPANTKPIIEGQNTNCWWHPEQTVAAIAQAHRAGKKWRVVARGQGQQYRDLRPDEANDLVVAVTAELA